MDGKRKTRVGRVVSNKMQKTVVVVVETPRRHPLYKKIVRNATRFKAHDEKGECGLGDLVLLEESRPLSREKRWRVARIVTKGQVAEVQPREIS